MRPTKVCAAATAFLIGIRPTGPPALAYYSAGAMGVGAVAAVQVVAPPPPTATFTTVTFLACFIHVTWTAPPAGRQYAVIRVTASGQSTVQTNTSVAGAKDDTILLSALLGGDPSYFIRSTLTGTTWTHDSAAADVHC